MAKRLYNYVNINHYKQRCLFAMYILVNMFKYNIPFMCNVPDEPASAAHGLLLQDLCVCLSVC